MSCKYKFKGREYTESEIMKVLSEDPEIIASYASQEERLGLDYVPEDIKTFNAKIAKLKESMDVEVVLDLNIPTSRVLGKADKRTKAAGKPVILINPDYLFKTTAIHEFGHIFVDSFPKGLKNPRIVKALAELKGTPLEAEVKGLYPELGEDMLAKEILATAIGRKGSEIWDNPEAASRFEAFKNWFFDFIRRTFGLNSNEVQRLSEDLISGKVNEDILANLDKNPQEQRHSRSLTAEQKDAKELEKSIDRVYSETLNKVILAHKHLTPTTKEAKSKQAEKVKAGAPTRFSAISELKEALEKYEKADKRKGLDSYVQWVESQMNFIKAELDRSKANDNLTDARIIKALNWNDTFKMIDDIQNLAEKMYRDGDITLEEKDVYRKTFSRIQGQRSEASSSLLEASRFAYAKLMAKNDVRIYEEYKEGYRKEYNELVETSGPQNTTVEEYIVQKMNDNKDAIENIAFEEALKAAERSESDITWAAGNIFSEKNAKSRDIQVLSKLVDEKEFIISRFASAEAAKFDKKNKEFKDTVGSSINQKEKYKGIYQESESGQHYLSSEYSADFYEQKMNRINEASNSDLYNEIYKGIEANPKTLNYTNSEGTTRRLNFENAKNINVAAADKDNDAVHVTYMKGKEEYTISMEQAIAKSELSAWLKENTIKHVVGSQTYMYPTKNWKNEDYANLTADQLSQLNFLKGKIRQADALYGDLGKLTKFANGMEFIKLPSVMKSDVARIAEGQIGGLLKHKASSAIETQADEFDEGNREDGTEEGDTAANAMRVFADITNKEKLRVPVAFRAKLEAKDHSLDLHTIILMNLVNGMNHQEKTELESTFLVVLDVMKKRPSAQHTGPGKRKKIHALTDKTIFKDPKDGLSREALKAIDVLENRIYGIKNKESGKIAGVQVHKAAQTVLKYSGAVALIGNYANSLINLNMGTLSNLTDAIGGDTFNLRDWHNAGKTYWKDMGEITKDMGANVVRSKTNLFLNMFNVIGGKEYIESNFEDSTRFQALMKSNSMRPFAKMGEHMMQAKTMYAVLKSIKAMNAKGQYLNKQGGIVKTKREAAGLDDMITFQKNKMTGDVSMKLDPKVKMTSFTSTGGSEQILLEARNLIKHKIIELHGLYDSDIQAAVQRQFLGKMLFFLRKWMIPGTLRRWRGATSMFKDVDDLTEVQQYYSQDAKANLEGYYVTAARFLATTLPTAVKDMNLAIFKTQANRMTPREKANIRKVVTELTLIASLWLLYNAMGDDDDENIFAKYVLRRQISELSFFGNPAEAIKIASTPTAAIGITKNVLRIVTQGLTNPTEEYIQGPRKGELKIKRQAQKLVPLLNIKKTEDFKEGLKFLNNMSL